MPRRPRLAIAGIPWHIVQRGNNRSACFFRDEDYRCYLETLEQQARKFACDVHAYVLMTNHVHLLLTPAEKESASLMMKHLNQRYVQYVNRIYRRTGTLWEGRFHSCLTQEDRYVLACYRYIEMNPVRAKMVADPAAYPWSSYRVNALGGPSDLISEHGAYAGLGGDLDERRATYRALFDVGMEGNMTEDIRVATHGNYALGSERFRRQVERVLTRRATPGQPGRPKRKLAR
ncbi:MAG: transposase [Arenicellales bacterium]